MIGFAFGNLIGAFVLIIRLLMFDLVSGKLFFELDMFDKFATLAIIPQRRMKNKRCNFFNLIQFIYE